MSRPSPVKQTQSRLEVGAARKKPRAIDTTRSRRYLPHCEGEHPIYFVTFRLVDSLPRDFVLHLRHHRESTKKLTPAAEAGADRPRAHDLDGVLETAEGCLDSGLGECHMRDSRIAKIVADAIQHFQGTRYNLLGWCVMPNHVHVVFAPLGENKLDATHHSWKSFSALMVNRLLQRRGIFWQREYFDHLVRNERSLLKILHYVKENPTRAGLPNWP